MPPKADMMTLARLHAALDSVVETQELLAQVRETSSMSPTALSRAVASLTDAREVLRSLLRPEPRQNPDSLSGSHTLL